MGLYTVASFQSEKKLCDGSCWKLHLIVSFGPKVCLQMIDRKERGVLGVLADVLWPRRHLMLAEMTWLSGINCELFKKISTLF